MDTACVFCKHHEFFLSNEEPMDGITLVGIEDCSCGAGHHNEHDATCAVFESNTGECPYFEAEEKGG